jgi:hypothetical protein
MQTYLQKFEFKLSENEGIMFNHFFAPLLVIFLAGLIGLGGFVWEGNSSPWGWE